MLGISTVKLVVAAVVVTAGLGLYWHYTNIKGERDAAMAQVGSLKQVTQNQAVAIDALEDNVQEWRNAFEEFQQALDSAVKNNLEAEKYAQEIDDVFSKHNLRELSKAKPGLIENRINSGTDRVLRMFEHETTGSP